EFKRNRYTICKWVGDRLRSYRCISSNAPHGGCRMKSFRSPNQIPAGKDRRKVFIRTAITAAVLGMSATSGALVVRHFTQTPEQILAIAPIDPGLCRIVGTGGWTATSVFFRIAQAENKPADPGKPRSEVKPFDYAVEGTSPNPQTEPWLWENLGTLSYPIT